MKKIALTLLICAAVGLLAYLGYVLYFAPREPELPLTTKAEKSYNRGLDFLFKQPYLNSQNIWYLRKVAAIDPGDRLDDFLDELHKDYKVYGSDRFFARMGFADAPAGDIEELAKLSTTFELMKAIFYAANCAEYPVYEQEMTPFILIPAPNYLLLAQIISIRIVEELGCKVTDEWAATRSELHQRMRLELTERTEFSDLTVTEVAMALLEDVIEKPSQDLILKIVENQDEDGRWRDRTDYRKYLAQIGFQDKVSIGYEHTTVTALLVLAAGLWDVPDELAPKKLLPPEYIMNFGRDVTDAGGPPRSPHKPPTK